MNWSKNLGLGLQTKDLIVLAILALFSLRVVTWFESPNILASGDFRPVFNTEAFTQRIFSSWDEIDFGVPSVYGPRILDPFYLFSATFQLMGANLFVAEIITLFLIYSISSFLMYLFVKQLTNGDTIASVVAALFLTSNVYLINDREVSAIGFVNITLMILPCMLTFLKSIKTDSGPLMVISGMLGVLTYATFPNYRTTLICLMMLGLIVLFVLFRKSIFGLQSDGSQQTLKISIATDFLSRKLKLLATFVTSFLLSSIWIFTLVLSNFDFWTTIHAEIAMPRVNVLQMYDIPRFIAKWAFYGQHLGIPLVPYAHVYSTNLVLSFLCFLPAVLAFSSLLSSKNRKIKIFFASLAIIFVVLASGFNFSLAGEELYTWLVSLPLLKAFREASNWMFFVVPFFGILIGLTVSDLSHKLKNRLSQIVLVGLIALLFVSTAYPLTTGDITRNYLNPEMKGSYLPESYIELNDELSSRHWTMLLPKRGSYVMYNFSQNRILSCGNPYPLLFSKPLISGAGTEYVQATDSHLTQSYTLIQEGIPDKNIAGKGSVSASSSESSEHEPIKAVDGKMETRWSSAIGIPQWLEIEWDEEQELFKVILNFERAHAVNYELESWNGYEWITQLSVENNTSLHQEHLFDKPVSTTKLRIYITGATRFGSVSIRELEVYPRTEIIPKFLGTSGIKHLIFSKDLIHGGAPFPQKTVLKETFIPVKEWDELSLFKNPYTLEKLYSADKVINYTTWEDMYHHLEQSEWTTLQHTIYINSTSMDNTIPQSLASPENMVWTQSSIGYEVSVTSEAPFFLVFLQNYDKNWKAYVNGVPVQESNHYQANAFSNAWLIESTEELAINIRYQPQVALIPSLIASIVLPLILLAAVSFNELTRKAINSLRKLKFKLLTLRTFNLEKE